MKTGYAPEQRSYPMVETESIFKAFDWIDNELGYCCTNDARAELTKLKALAALAEEMAGAVVEGKLYGLRPFDAAWLTRYNAITKDGGK